jgi:transcriptional regulator with XRE-family HTH domain
MKNEPSALCERIGLRVRRRRAELRYSLADLAGRTELSKTHLWQVEQGRSEPGAGVIVRLCRALGVSADWLLGVGEES